jgi:hypothetical protein
MAMKLALLALFLVCLPGLAHDISGAWEFTVETDAGGGNPTFVFKQEGEKLTGTYSGLFGKAELAGTVKGDAIEFSFQVENAQLNGKVVYKGKVEGPSKMKGEVDLAGLAKGTWTGVKK